MMQEIVLSLDALWDSITHGDMPPSCRALVDRFVALISEARAEGHPVEIVCL